MSPEIKSLIQSRALKKIGDEAFLSAYFKNGPPDKAYCLALIKEGLNNKNTEILEEALFVTTVADFEDNTFSETYCELLLTDWHHSHEDIARSLQDLKDPATVNCLFAAAELQFMYLNYDGTFQFARKCIKALAAIGDENAIDKLRLLAESEIDDIAAYAKKELRYKNLE